LGWIVLAEENPERLVLRAIKNLPPISGIKTRQLWDDGISSLLLKSGEGIMLAGEPLAKMRASQVAKAVVAAPIKAKDKIMGVLVVGNKTGQPFTERNLAMLSTVADYASIALVNAYLFRALDERAKALQKSLDDLSAGNAAYGEMMRRVGEETRAPLEQARAALAPLLRHESGPLLGAQEDGLRLVLDRLTTVQRVTENMALLSEPRVQAPSLRSLVLRDIARQVMANLGESARQNGVDLLTDFPSEIFRVAGDPAQIARVIDNLLDNAIRFSPQGGQVTLRLRSGPQGAVHVEVIDHGIGIPADHLPRVWEKFYQVKSTSALSFGGVGLGLAVVKKVVEAHGGRVWAQSEPGRGSTFGFSLVKA
jgi:signal transduction histidine kinase